MNNRQKHFFILLGAATLMALFLRAVVCMQLADTPEVAHPSVQTDMGTYLRLAQEIRHGQWPDHYDYQPFYYTAVLPFLTSDSGSITGLLVFQSLIGAAAVWLAGLCAAQLYGRTCGWLAGLLLAMAKFHVFYTPFALYEVLQSFWTILLFFLTLLSWRHNRLRDWLAVAVVLAVAILTRGNALLFLPIVLLALFFRNRHTPAGASATRRHLQTALLAVGILFIVYLPQLPFAIRNYHYTGHWTGPSTAADKVLVLGNSPEAPAAGLAYPLTYTKWVAQSDSGQRSALTNIFGWFCDHPLAFCELKFRTLLHFWDAEEVANNVNIQVHGIPYSSLLATPLLFPFALLGTLAVAGLFLPGSHNSAGHKLLVSFVLVFCAATVMFYMLARFRIAIVPLLCVLGCGTIAAAYRLYRQRQLPKADMPRRSPLPLVIACATGLFVVNGALGLYQYGYESAAIQLVSPHGICAHFPNDTTLIHNHGPLPLGVSGCLPMPGIQPDQSLTVHEQFFIPQDLRSELYGKPFSARIMVYSMPQLTANGVTLLHGGQSQPATLVNLYAFSHWLEARFDHLSINGQGYAEVSFALPPGTAMCAAVDSLRDSPRLDNQLNGAPSKATFQPYAEIQFVY